MKKISAFVIFIILLSNASAEPSIFQMGIITLRNEISGMDYRDALNLFKEAANNGDMKATEKVGLMYHNGFGTERDDMESIRWYKISSDKGSMSASLAIANIYHTGVNNPFAVDEQKAIAWLQLSAERGSADAEFILGDIFSRGIGNEKGYIVTDDNEAIKWYQLSANHGNVKAMNRVGTCYLNGKGVPKDNKMALKWFESAFASGDKSAESIISKIKLDDAYKASFERRIEQEKRDEVAHIAELKSRKYSWIPASMNVQTFGSTSGSNTISVISKDDSPVLLERVLINNRVSEIDCDFKEIYKYLKMGNKVDFSPAGCGEKIIKVEIFTNRGSSTYRFK